MIDEGREIPSSFAEYTICNKNKNNENKKACVLKAAKQKKESQDRMCDVVAKGGQLEAMQRGVQSLISNLQLMISNQGCIQAGGEAFLRNSLMTIINSQAISLAGSSGWGGVAALGAEVFENFTRSFTSGGKAQKILSDLAKDDQNEENACLMYALDKRINCAEYPVIHSCNVSGKDLSRLDSTPTSGNSPVDQMMRYLNNQSLLTAMKDDLSASESFDQLVDLIKNNKDIIADSLKNSSRQVTAIGTQKLNDFLTNPCISMQKCTDREVEELKAIVLEGGNKSLVEILKIVLSKIATPSLQLDSLSSLAIYDYNLEVSSRQKLNSQHSIEAISKISNLRNIVINATKNDQEKSLKNKFDKFVTSIERDLKSNSGNAAMDSKGNLIALVKHCSLLQSYYTDGNNTKIPDVCSKINCGKNNQLNWYFPPVGQENVTNFRKHMCRQNVYLPAILDDYTNELNMKPSRICGKDLKSWMNENRNLSFSFVGD